jgi:hypothetical protein
MDPLLEAIKENPLMIVMVVQQVAGLLLPVISASFAVQVAALAAAALATVWLLVSWFASLREVRRVIVYIQGDGCEENGCYDLIEAVVDHFIDVVGAKRTQAELIGKREWHKLPANGEQYRSVKTSHRLPRDREIRACGPMGSFIIKYRFDLERSQKDLSQVRETRTVTIRARGPFASKQIDDLVEACVKRYNDKELAEFSKDVGILYVWRPMISKSGKLVYIKYPVHTGYCLTDAICPRLPDLLRHIAGLTEGKKLGMLLHGPPGTGKTTLIKSLAEFLGRHIVCVNLGHYETDPASLEQLLLTGRFRALSDDDDGDEEMSVRMQRIPLDRLVICFEELDVHANLLTRDGKSREAKDDEAAGYKFEKIEEAENYRARNANRLTLQALLEMLDGTVDTPGRVVVGTTNCPEVVDPALRRPARLGDFDLELGPLSPDHVAAAFEKRFGVPPEGPLATTTIAALQATLATAADADDAFERLQIKEEYHPRSVDDSADSFVSSVEKTRQRGKKNKKKAARRRDIMW